MALLIFKGQASAEIRPSAGGRLVSLALADSRGELHDVLAPYSDRDVVRGEWAKGGAFPLIPYSNRISNGQLQFGDTNYALPPHPSVAPHTLHGNSHLQAWEIESRSPNAVTIKLESSASLEWPWRYRAWLRFELQSPSRLGISMRLTNTDTTAQPAGIGFHPYFAGPPTGEVLHNADKFWPVKDDGTPIGPNSEPFLRTTIQVPTLHLCDWQGDASIRLASGGLIHLKASESFRHLVVHRPVGRNYLCVEPASHVVDGFHLAQTGAANTGSRRLHPGESLEGELAIAVSASEKPFNAS